MEPATGPFDPNLLKLWWEKTLEFQSLMQQALRELPGSLNIETATTPHEILYQKDRVRLKHYLPLIKTGTLTPLLIVYALINRDTILDLEPERSVVQNFLKEGIDLYMIDWGSPGAEDRHRTIDDHVNGYLDNIVDFIRHRHQIIKVNLMGVCMGGTFAVMYAALHPKKIKNLVTAVTPTNFHAGAGPLVDWIKGVDVDRMMEAWGNMPGGLLTLGFLLLSPTHLLVEKYRRFLENWGNKEFLENFIRMEQWIFDGPDVPGETFRQFLKDCYQQDLLIKNRMALGGKRVNLKKITMPLLNLYGKYDHLVPPEACAGLTQKVGSKDTEEVCLDTGHIGMFVSSKSQAELVPRIVQWLRERDRPDEGLVKRRGPKKGTEKVEAQAKPSPPPKKARLKAGIKAETGVVTPGGQPGANSPKLGTEP